MFLCFLCKCVSAFQLSAVLALCSHSWHYFPHSNCFFFCVCHFSMYINFRLSLFPPCTKTLANYSTTASSIRPACKLCFWLPDPCLICLPNFGLPLCMTFAFSSIKSLVFMDLYRCEFFFLSCIWVHTPALVIIVPYCTST